MSSAELSRPSALRDSVILGGLGALLIAGFMLSLWVGRGGLMLPSALQPVDEVILYEVRLPRALLGLLVGAVLGLSGAALQGLLRNPLAEPGLIGASSGAALGAVAVFYFPIVGAAGVFLPVGGFLGAMGALVLLYFLVGRHPDVMTLILAGVAINAFATALTSLALNLAPSPFAALEIVFWMLGSFADRSMDHVWFILAPVLVGSLMIAVSARSLDALSLGRDTARSLGFHPERVTWLIIGGTGLAVGSSVAVTGVIGFVGLVVPHLMRPLFGQRPGRLLLPSALAGAVLTLLADILVRLPMRGPELKLGVVTALIGAPFFLWLIIRTRRSLQP